MAATFFQSVMEWRTTKSVSETVSGTVSERSRRQFWSADISGRQNSRSFPVPIYRESKTRAVFSSRYIGKPKTHAIFCHQMFALEAAVEAFRVQNAVHVGSARPSTRIWRIGPQSCKGFSIFSAAFEARPVTGGKSGYFVEEEKLGIVLPWL